MRGKCVDPDETLRLPRLIWVYTVCSGLSDQIHTIKYNIWNGHAQTGKIITKSSAITDRLSITMAGLMLDYLFRFVTHRSFYMDAKNKEELKHKNCIGADSRKTTGVWAGRG